MKNMNPKVKEILEWLYCIAIAIVLALLIRYYIGTPTIVKQPSMYPTLIQDQRLILNRLARTLKSEIKKGDIITFEEPDTTYIPAYEIDINNPVAKYDIEPKGLFEKFVYYVLEINKKSYIKRVIATEGDHIQIQNGKVYLNGEELIESYLQPGVNTENLNGAFTDVTIPQGYVYVMGDNRSQSTDSRRFGCIPIDKIESKVWIRFWPFNLFGEVK